jgi:hypothetical protein
MTNPIHIEPTEKDEAIAIRREFLDIAQQLGRIELAKWALEKERKAVEQRFDALEKRESEFLSALTKKYGQGQLNIETGEFIPATTE